MISDAKQRMNISQLVSIGDRRDSQSEKKKKKRKMKRELGYSTRKPLLLLVRVDIKLLVFVQRRWQGSTRSMRKVMREGGKVMFNMAKLRDRHPHSSLCHSSL